MAKKKRRRSAIVPAMILSAGIMTGAAVVPLLSGCKGEKYTVGAQAFTVADACFCSPLDAVAFLGFDMRTPDFSVSYPDGFSVAKEAFDLSRDDADPKDAG